MPEIINFPSITTFLGRNGQFKQAGMLVSHSDQVVSLSPITSKGEEGRCSITLPVTQIPELMEALNHVALQLGRQS